jgi:hypothetical protein
VFPIDLIPPADAALPGLDVERLAWSAPPITTDALQITELDQGPDGCLGVEFDGGADFSRWYFCLPVDAFPFALDQWVQVSSFAGGDVVTITRVADPRPTPRSPCPPSSWSPRAAAPCPTSPTPCSPPRPTTTSASRPSRSAAPSPAPNEHQRPLRGRPQRRSWMSARWRPSWASTARPLAVGRPRRGSRGVEPGLRRGPRRARRRPRDRRRARPPEPLNLDLI